MSGARGPMRLDEDFWRYMAGLPFKVWRWNMDKPHRCPRCHSVVKIARKPWGGAYRWYHHHILRHLPDRPRACDFVVHKCCVCLAKFARWPALAWLLPTSRLKCEWHDHETEKDEA